MEFGVLTRGSRKIYILVKADCPQGHRLVAHSKTFTNYEVPAFIVTKNADRGEYVLIIPILYAGQTVTVTMLDENGESVDSITRRVGHLSSNVASKANTFNKVEGVEGIRNIDKLPLLEESHIDVNRMSRLYYSDKSELVYIIITASCPDMSEAASPYHIELIDRGGVPIDIKDLSVFQDTTEPVVPGSEHLVRTIHLSFRKPASCKWFTIWARFDSPSIADGFESLDDGKTDFFRAKFEDAFGFTGQSGQYEEWFYWTQKKSQLELEAQRDVHFEIEPLFSIIVPLYKTPLALFDEMAQSVLGQTYGRLELILVNASPEDAELGIAVAECARQDERVRVVTLDGNYGIALNTNEGIKVAKGDFLSFFDHDDVLELNILFEYVDALNRYPETDLFYCDEDKLLDGHYLDGHLKSDFSWELLATCNYVCHLLTVRKSIVDEVGMSPEEVAGSQDWDMTMRVAEKARNIFHVRKVLYHWRMHKQSASSNPESKPYTHTAGEIALKNHFDRIGVPVKIADGPVINMHRIDYILPDNPGKVSIIIPSKDEIDMLDRCLTSIWEKTTYPDYEVVVVENNSAEPETFAYYDRAQAEHENLKVVRYEDEFNFSAICNFGAHNSSGAYLLFLNNDTEVITPEWIDRLRGPLERDEVGAVGAKLLFPDDTIQHAGVIIPKSDPKHVATALPKDADFYFGMIRNARDVLAVTGACLLVSRADFDSIDGFDEGLAVAYNDVDFCLRLYDKGRHIIIDPNTELYHYESVSRGYDVLGESRSRRVREVSKFQMRWHKFIGQGDPYYGVNISAGDSNYGLDWNVRA